MTSELKEKTSPAVPVETAAVRELPVETPTAEAAAAGSLRPDHVRSHSMRCYWDFVECRWRCSGD